ncbi:MAG: NYN domain-containing protein [Candidatus Campbellbacteria bacterium]|nr:NYN domain-containing protein [Candidatus Campbellbacteria bacterium]
MQENNFAFIDSQNLHISITRLGWKLDFKRFRVYLREKYHVQKAYLFIGYVEENASLYRSLQEKGYVLIFKPTLKNSGGAIKGNCDAELVLQVMIDYPNYDKAVIISGDGDFHCLVKYLIEKQKLQCIIVPDRFKFSALLNFEPIKPFLRFANDLRIKLEYKKKRPHKDETL